MAKCAFCGRTTTPFVFIGNEAIGQKCARRAGLLKEKVAKGSSIRFVSNQSNGGREKFQETMGLFEFADGIKQLSAEG